ncbi:transferase 2, rSAM/selenodomain-associated [Mariprofundus ferrinatatus]|uniref:Transferase 2, rSAM/selenodomain-associated n=1 Tax=Mariprofundus ferrinatatus TaxID=1921087 RepID=A0A2K8LC21_9PROT|nr:transferase 2, rSAM/selenodomain-associated [Mariprofundus ferrinatatus]
MRGELTVAAVVPVLNEAALLSVLIDRLRSLNLDECVIVDGGSSDSTCTMLEKSGLTWISSEAGRAKQMNAGSAMCKADIILFIHADTFLSSSCLEALREVCKRSEVIAGRFNLRLSGKQSIYRVIESMINLRSRISKISTGDQCIFVRRAQFEAMGGFTDIPLMEDVELSMRLKRQGEIACLREQVVTSSRRWEQFGPMNTLLLMWKLRILFWMGVAPDKLAVMYRDAR